MAGRLFRRTWEHNPTLDAPPKYRKACHYDTYIPDELSTFEFALDARLAGLVADTEHAIQTLNDEGGSALAPLARLLLRTESIASSRVEGLQMGVRELARAEAEADVGGRAGPTALDVLANIDAMTLAVAEAAAVPLFSIGEIQAIHHRLISRGSHSRIAGVLRTRQNWIGGNDYNPCGAEFVPPPPEEVATLLSDLCAATNDKTLSPLVQAALVHAQFETIHPFDDGNGRTGRALVHVVLRRRGLTPVFLPPISVIFAGARDRYIEGLTSFRGPSVTTWIEQFASATWQATRLASAYIRAVRELQAEWRRKLAASSRAPREGAAAWALIDVLPAHPVISGPVAATATGRARAAVYNAIDQLVSAGILEPLSESRRNRSWEAQDLLPLIAQLEAGAIPV
ncbi:MAG: Fic family protein [Gemmatimonadota bacterium]